jgi:hypothetical protein
MDFDAAKMSREEMIENLKKKPGKKKVAKFPAESDLCAAFMASLPDGWTAYPETAGFDILLVRKDDGFQIGIEAKLKLNGKVICQIAERTEEWYICRSGPDCRAVLVPEDASGELGGVCGLLGLTVIRQAYTLEQAEKRKKSTWSSMNGFHPELPRLSAHHSWNDRWHEFAPHSRCKVPDYIPDVGAGHSGPVMLTHWKIAAIKIAVTLEKRGYVTRQDFKHHQISMSRWTQGGWILRCVRGWEKGKLPDFKAQHPRNYVEIEADYDTWVMPDSLMTAKAK